MEEWMKRFSLWCTVFLLLPFFVSGQTILWSYKANGSSSEHFRSVKNIGDVDGDTHDDVIGSSENDTLYCFSGIDGTPIWKFDADPCYLERGLIAVPDLDGDSLPDVILGTVWGTRAVFALSGATGDTIWWYDTHEYGNGGWVYEVAPMTDIDGDSTVDILISTGSVPDRAYLFSGWDPRDR
jgi:outer membrane protein assembly factor BamB